MTAKKKTKIAIFDIDGTIFRKNLHFELINELTWMKVFPREARDELANIYSGWLTHEGTYEDYRKALVKLYSEHIRGCAQASVYAVDEQGRYTSEASFEPSKNKGSLVEQYLYEHKLSLKDSYGIGDTESDSSFLKMVEHPIAFNPNQNLKAAAEEHGWKIVVEKKDVVYEI